MLIIDTWRNPLFNIVVIDVKPKHNPKYIFPIIRYERQNPNHNDNNNNDNENDDINNPQLDQPSHVQPRCPTCRDSWSKISWVREVDHNNKMMAFMNDWWTLLNYKGFDDRKYLNCSYFQRLGVAVFPLEKYEEALHKLRTGAIAKAVFDLSL